MSDIVERLKKDAVSRGNNNEAADTIEALRAELADMRERCKLNYELGVERGKMDAEALRAENARLREALKQIHDAVDFPEDTLRRKIRAARAAIGESDE